MVAFCIARVLPIAFGSTLHCTRSPASRAIAKSKRGRYGPSANNWKFRGHRDASIFYFLMSGAALGTSRLSRPSIFKGGLNGSMQHRLEAHAQGFKRLRVVREG